MKQLTCLFLLSVFVIPMVSYPQADDKTIYNPVDYVNPFIGTGGHGHTFPGATVPFGMVQLSPDTRLEGWDGCSGYHYSDTYIYGFSHTHLSGTGVPDYCDILLMPVTGDIVLNNGADGKAGYRSFFSHESEKASPGYYEVLLEDYNIKAQLTTTNRVGFHKYSYPTGKTSSVIIDLKHRDDVTNSWMKVVSKNEIEGFRGSTGWARDQRVYFVVRFSHSISKYGLAVNDSTLANKAFIEGNNVKGWFSFNVGDASPLLAKVGISAVSAENARQNLDAEITDWDFEKVRQMAVDNWSKELSKISVSGKNEDQKTVFYTAMYHSMISPNTYNDVNGDYLGRDLKTHSIAKNAGDLHSEYYTVFSLWDTYRALHPLFTIIDHKRTNAFIRTFLHQYDDGGLLPVWELAANETWCMIGYHAVPVIADAWMKGIRGYDREKALRAMQKSAMENHFGLEFYKKYGFIPAELEHESVSKTLEYGYDDWCIATMANETGDKKLRDEFTLRAQAYKHIYDPESGFMRARYNGGWFNPFAPEEVNFNYTEANSWQYSFYVPHDMNGFMQMLGGKDKLSEKLDGLFSASSETTGRDQSDITGLIGQYAHGNEPSHHIAYLYNYCGQPWKTQKLTSGILKDFYTTQPDGLIGNEDCGQMSAWAIFSSLGFYPVCPGMPEYAIGSPIFDEAVINLESGKKFIIETKNVSDKNIYIQKVFLNGKEFQRSYLRHSEIMDGGKLVFEMGPEPSKSFGTGSGNLPESGISSNLVQAAPYAIPSAPSFREELEVSLHSTHNAKIRYTTDGSVPDEKSMIYDKPLNLKASTTLNFVSFANEFPPSVMQQAKYTRMPEGIEMQLLSNYEPQYSGSGQLNLIDGLKGSNDFRLGGWQGYQGEDIMAVLHLMNDKPLKGVNIGFLQDVNAWIFMPQSVQLWKSADGVNYTQFMEIGNEIPVDQWGLVIKDFAATFPAIKERYLKVVAKNIGICPEWHPGRGSKAWIFSDEIELKF